MYRYGPWICRGRGFMDNPQTGAGLPTSSTPAWTTLRVDHISTATAAANDLFIINDLKTENLNVAC